MASVDFSGDLPQARWPDGAIALADPAIALEVVWEAERAPLREVKFCAHLAASIGAAVVEMLANEFQPLITVTLIEEDRKLMMLIRAEGVFADARAATASDVEHLSAVLNDASLRGDWIWAAIDATAYKGVAQ